MKSLNGLQTVGFRLAAWHAALFVAGSLAVLATSYVLLSSSLRDNDRALVRAELQELTAAYDKEGENGLAQEAAEQKLLPRDCALIRLSERAGTTRFLAGPAALSTEGFEVLAVPLADGARLEVGKSLQPREEVLARARRNALAIAIPALLLGLAGGGLLTRRTLRPVRRLIETVRDIEGGRIGARVPPSGAEDELEELGRLFNRMLDRIEGLVSAMRGSLDAVAHDLRTPMTRLRGEAELALGAKDDAASREALGACIEQADEILGLLARLMDVSEAEAGAMKLERDPLDVAVLAREMAELYADAAEDKGLSVAVEAAAPLPVNGDRVRLRQAAANLLDNAVKFAPRGGCVWIKAYQAGPNAVLEVADDGPGIPDAELARIWDRLFRGELGRAQKGLGLGLSLVRAVALAHGGDVEAGGRPGGGARLRLKLPLKA